MLKLEREQTKIHMQLKYINPKYFLRRYTDSF